MATCPKCGTTLKEDYGMSHCPKCGAFSFIDMDGVAVIQDESPGGPDANSNYGATPHEEPGGGASSSSFSDPIESLIDVPSESGASGGFGSLDDLNSDSGGFGDKTKIGEPSRSESSFDPIDMSPEHESFEPVDTGGSSSNDIESFEPIDMSPSSNDSDSFEPIDMSPSSEATSEAAAESAAARSRVSAKAQRPEPSFGPANDPLNLNEFANSEVSAAKDGPLLVRVLISGIDTREIRESIREVLEDSRFAWDSNEIFSKVSKGNLTINALSPVKASILITRIKRLPVQIRWEQYAITQGQN